MREVVCFLLGFPKDKKKKMYQKTIKQRECCTSDAEPKREG